MRNHKLIRFLTTYKLSYFVLVNLTLALLFFVFSIFFGVTFILFIFTFYCVSFYLVYRLMGLFKYSFWGMI